MVNSTSPWEFLAASGGVRSRVFLLAHDAPGRRPVLTQVTTVTAGPEQADTLVAALNEAVVTGNRGALDARLSNLPDAVALACTRALDRCGTPTDGARGAGEGAPTALQERTYADLDVDLVALMWAARTLGLQIVVSNSRDNGLSWSTQVYPAGIDLPQLDGPLWPYPPEDARLIKRTSYRSACNLASALDDARWDVFHSRAYWAWAADERVAGGRAAVVVVEHFDRPLEAGATYLDFHEDDDAVDGERGLLTPRNRFQLYAALFSMSRDLARLVSEWPRGRSYVRTTMPHFVRGQPLDWWRSLQTACVRLFEAARTGALDDLRPRTVADEALITFATRREYVTWADEVAADELALSWQFERLPRDDRWDGRNEDIPFTLVGDTDFEEFLPPHLGAMRVFGGPSRGARGRRDYSPDAWYRSIDEAR